MAQFKATVTTHIRSDSPGLEVWQRNYHERIIRDETELGNKRQYIENNPANWDTDSEGPYGPRQCRYSEENQ